MRVKLAAETCSHFKVVHRGLGSNDAAIGFGFGGGIAVEKREHLASLAQRGGNPVERSRSFAELGELLHHALR